MPGNTRPVGSAKGKDVAWNDMGIDVTAETLVARPRDVVRSYVIDPANDTKWIGGISEARLVTEGAVDVGTRVARVASFLGKRIEYMNEVTALTDDELEMRSVQGPFPMHITYGFVPDGNGTRMTVRVRGESGGFYRIAGPLLARQVRRSIGGDVERLRRLFEDVS